jgi:hypothetical protein
VPNRIQSLFGVEYPIVQAPMTYIARAELAAAVSEAGGLGMIETLTPEGRSDLHRVRELTDKPVAANLMIQGWKRDPSIVDVLAEAEVRHVFSSTGDPALFTGRLQEAGMTVVHVVGSLRAAMKAVDDGSAPARLQLHRPADHCSRRYVRRTLRGCGGGTRRRGSTDGHAHAGKSRSSGAQQFQECDRRRKRFRHSASRPSG